MATVPPPNPGGGGGGLEGVQGRVRVGDVWHFRLVIDQAPEVESAIHGINHYPTDSATGSL